MPFAPVLLDDHDPTEQLAALEQPATLADMLRLGRQLGDSGLRPGQGATGELFETLATLASADLAVARAIEPHLDAVAILTQADRADLLGDETTWGVFAAEGATPLSASQSGDAWLLTGIKPWCSLAGSLDRALVSATADDGSRRLFAVDLTVPEIDVAEDRWHAKGLIEIPSGPVTFRDVSATPVGEPGWYLSRPGFSWGGITVAACWYGGAVGLGRTLFDAVRERDQPGDILLMQLGSLDESLSSARRGLAEAAAAIDAGDAVGTSGTLLAKRVRSTVARAAETAIRIVGHALGPAPLALDAGHAKRVADLELYVRQHHAERDDRSLGATLAAQDRLPW